jgi:hypothetical protein
MPRAAPLISATFPASLGVFVTVRSIRPRGHRRSREPCDRLPHNAGSG